MQEVINLIKKLAIQENKTDVSMICKIAASMMFKSNRNLFQIFKNLEENPENYMADFKFKLSMKEAINMKIKMKLTVEQYRMLKNFPSDYLTLPGYTNLAINVKQLMPMQQNPLDFNMDGEILGKYWPLENVLPDTIKDILQNFHGDNPERVESNLYIKGGFGGDGFSGCVDRHGKDVDLNTSSRYFVGMKIARIVGERKLDQSFTGPTEYFVETSQSFKTVKPILIGHFKEDQSNLHDVWSSLQDQWQNMKEFTIQLHGREIKVHFENPKLIGDGKCFLQLLGLPCAYCYLCYVERDDAQCCDKLNNPGFKIERSIKGMRNEVRILKKKWIKSKTKKKFTAYFSEKQRNYMVRYPTFKADGFSILNIPTLHFKGHVFDYIKKLAYQMNSRRYTTSRRSVAEIKALRGNKDIMRKYKVRNQLCRNANCRKVCKGFVPLLTHVLKKSQECLDLYNDAEILEELEKNCQIRKKI